MARPTRTNAQRRSVPKVEQDLRDLAELAACAEESISESEPVTDILNLGHAGLGSECWSGVSGRGLGCYRSEFAAPQFATQRLRGPRRHRTQLHHSRPLHSAEARFTADDREMLTF
jgi:hypothetical protein